MIEKKVIVVVVEGPSEETAIGGILNDFFSSNKIQFRVVRGDITSEKGIKKTDIKNKVKSLVDDLKNKYGYKDADFFMIIHITDTDGVFTTNCIKTGEKKGVQYFEDHIECQNVTEIKKRNERKADNLHKLWSSKPCINKIPYYIYYNSCNLEHVLYGKLRDFSDEEKEEMAYAFADKYDGKLKEFIELISGKDVAAPGNTYKETWEFIEKDGNSLKRHSNMYLIFLNKEK